MSAHNSTERHKTDAEAGRSDGEQNWLSGNASSVHSYLATPPTTTVCEDDCQAELLSEGTKAKTANFVLSIIQIVCAVSICILLTIYVSKYPGEQKAGTYLAYLTSFSVGSVFIIILLLNLVSSKHALPVESTFFQIYHLYAVVLYTLVDTLLIVGNQFGIFNIIIIVLSTIAGLAHLLHTFLACGSCVAI